MIDLKTHNDITQKLIEENEKQQRQLEQLKVKMRKLQQVGDVVALKEKEMMRKTQDSTMKTTKQQKQLKDKVDALSKTLISRDLEISELKERLALKINISDKERDKMLEDFRKWQGRKPNNSNDYKMMSVINHYEGQIDKIQKQADKFKLEWENSQEMVRVLKKQLIDRDKENCDGNIENIQSYTNNLKQSLDSISAQRRIRKMEGEIIEMRRKTKEQQQEKMELRGRYEEITKEYYRLVNQEGGVGVAVRPPTKHTRVEEVRYAKKPTENSSMDAQSLQYSRSLNKLLDCDEHSLTIAEHPSNMIVSELMGMFGVHREEDLLPAARKVDAAVKTLPKIEHCLNSVKQAIESVTNRSLSFTNLPQTVNQLHKQRISLVNIVQSIQNKLGVTLQNILPQLAKLKRLSDEYIECLRTASFLRGVQNAKQLEQFMKFFNLEPEKEISPQVLQLYEQIKSIRQFVGLCNKILQTELSVPDCLMKVVDVLTRHTTSQS